jgi:hypothetical protein
MPAGLVTDGLAAKSTAFAAAFLVLTFVVGLDGLPGVSPN